MRAGGVILLLYIVVGVIVAATNDYFQALGNITNILQAIVAVLAWPLILLGVDINFAGDLNGNGGGNGGGGGGNDGGGGGS
jgi:hypothetical protein